MLERFPPLHLWGAINVAPTEVASLRSPFMNDSPPISFKVIDESGPIMRFRQGSNGLDSLRSDDAEREGEEYEAIISSILARQALSAKFGSELFPARDPSLSLRMTPPVITSEQHLSSSMDLHRTFPTK